MSKKAFFNMRKKRWLPEWVERLFSAGKRREMLRRKNKELLDKAFNWIPPMEVRELDHLFETGILASYKVRDSALLERLPVETVTVHSGENARKKVERVLIKTGTSKIETGVTLELPGLKIIHLFKTEQINPEAIPVKKPAEEEFKI